MSQSEGASGRDTGAAARAGTPADAPDAGTHPNACVRCGEVHERAGRPTCSAHRRDGHFCTMRAIAGTNVCKMHGARAPAVKAAARRRVAEAEITKLLDVTDWAPVTNPFTALADVVGEIVAVKDVLREKVETLPSLEDAGAETYATQLHVVMQAYERFLDHSAKYLTAMSRVTIDAQVAKLQHAVDAGTARMMTGALDGALGAIELSPADRAKVLAEFGKRLRVEETAELGKGDK